MYNYFCDKTIVFLHLVIVLVVFIGVSCTPDFKYGYRQEAVQKRYKAYVNDIEFRASVDRKWLQSNNSLGYGFLPHPYGDKHLNDLGIEKKINHKYSHK